MLPNVTTGMSSVFDAAPILMTGEEKYPIVGTAIDSETIKKIVCSFKGLNRHWNCVDKAQKSQAILGRGIVVGGSLMVLSVDLNSSYGYYWNPPFEFHAWVDLGDGLIFDAALAGVIEKGLTTEDAIGPYLVGNTPVILAGPPMGWTAYKQEEVLDELPNLSNWNE